MSIGQGVGAAQGSLALSAPGSAAPILYTSVDAPGTARAVQTWRVFFADRGVEAQCPKAGTKPEFAGQSAVLAFETEAACPLATRMGLDLSGLKDARDEAHVLTVRLWNGRPLMLVVGKTAAGADAGAAQLLSKVACNITTAGSWTVVCEPLEALRQPFLRGREATLCPTGRVLGPGSLVNYENWDKPRLERYLRYLVQSGVVQRHWGREACPQGRWYRDPALV